MTTSKNLNHSTQQTTARMPRAWSLNERRQRSLALADERREISGGMRAIHFQSVECDPWSGELQTLTVAVDSAHEEGTRYTVVYVAGDDLASCSCASGSRGAPCWHAGQAYTYAQSAIEAYAPVGREEAIQEQYQAWINESPESL